MKDKEKKVVKLNKRIKKVAAAPDSAKPPKPKLD